VKGMVIWWDGGGFESRRGFVVKFRDLLQSVRDGVVFEVFDDVSNSLGSVQQFLVSIRSLALRPCERLTKLGQAITKANILRSPL